MKKLLILLFQLLTMSILSYGEVIETVLIPQGEEIRGFNKNRDAYFFIEENWDIKNAATINLELSYSELTKGNNSSITYYINDKPISSIALNTDNDKITKKIEIPKEYLKIGVNKFSIRKLQMITEDKCSLEGMSPANWIRIDKAFLFLEYAENNSKIDLSSFPLPFLHKYSDSGEKMINILMHEKATGREKIGLANVAAFLGNLNSNSKDEVHIVNINNVEKLDDNFIVISEFNRLPDILKKSFTDEEVSLMRNGVALKMIDNFINPEKKIIIQTSISRNMGNGINWLIDKKLLKQISGKFTVIQDYSDTKYADESLKRKISFRSLGINNIMLSGIGKNRQSIKISLPKDEKRDNVILKLKLGFSELIRDNRSTLRVIVNGENIWDKEFTSFNNDLSVSIPLSKELTNNDRSYYIEFESNLLTEFDCGGVPEPWIEVKSESSIESDITEETEFTIHDFPAPFIKGGKYNKLGLTVSDDFESLKFMFELFRIMGAKLSIPGNITYFENDDIDKNIIVIGNPKDNPVIEQLSKNLFLKYNRERSNFLSDVNFQFLGNNIYSAVQLMKEKESHNLVIFTDKNMYYRNILNNFKSNKFQGDSYLAINIKEGIDLDINKVVEEKDTSNKEKKVEAGKILILLLLGFAGLAIYMIKKKDNDDNDDEIK
ncbi:MAG: cellulose biosynthesis cyclic di-GMP-binding regulatory protein BcsB [Fusobacteriaceae bacterium]